MLSNGTVSGSHHKDVLSFLPLHTVLNVFTVGCALTTARKTLVLQMSLPYTSSPPLSLASTLYLNVLSCYHQQEPKPTRVATAAFHPTQCVVHCSSGLTWDKPDLNPCLLLIRNERFCARYSVKGWLCL